MNYVIFTLKQRIEKHISLGRYVFFSHATEKRPQQKFHFHSFKIYYYPKFYNNKEAVHLSSQARTLIWPISAKFGLNNLSI
jgi:hypothetical protein